MEDYELVTRLRKHGRPAIVPHAIVTSGRRWRRVGFVQTTLINQVSPGITHCSVQASRTYDATLTHPACATCTEILFTLIRMRAKGILGVASAETAEVCTEQLSGLATWFEKPN